jgi:hypothetical protein
METSGENGQQGSSECLYMFNATGRGRPTSALSGTQRKVTAGWRKYQTEVRVQCCSFAPSNSSLVTYISQRGKAIKLTDTVMWPVWSRRKITAQSDTAPSSKQGCTAGAPVLLWDKNLWASVKLCSEGFIIMRLEVHFRPWRRGQQIPPKRRYVSKDLHELTSQKTVTLITYYCFLHQGRFLFSNKRMFTEALESQFKNILIEAILNRFLLTL